MVVCQSATSDCDSRCVARTEPQGGKRHSLTIGLDSESRPSHLAYRRSGSAPTFGYL